MANLIKPFPNGPEFSIAYDWAYVLGFYHIHFKPGIAKSNSTFFMGFSIIRSPKKELCFSLCELYSNIKDLT